LRMLTDDTSYVVDPGDEGEAMGWGLAAPCKILDKTLDLLSWTRALPRRPGRGPGEYAIDVNGPELVRQLVTPKAIVFLDPPNPQRHEIKPMDKLSAVRAITRENVRAFEPSASGPNGRAFQVFTGLIGQCSTYSLSAGPRLDDLPECIERLLDE